MGQRARRRRGRRSTDLITLPLKLIHRSRNDNDDDDYLPKVSYNMLKDKQIRDLLSEHELPTTGDHATLVSRHQRWVSIYNANVDRNPQYRRRVSELRVELKKWEKDREAGLKKGSSKDAAMQVNVKEYRVRRPSLSSCESLC